MFTSSYWFQFFKAQRFFKRSQKWTMQEVVDYQNSKLIEIVQHAGKNVPYYRNLFQEIGLNPMDFKGISDINKIPFLEKDTIRKTPELLLADNYQIFGGEWTRTSGSTGTPLRLYIDNVSKAYKYAAVIRAYRMAGYSLHAKSMLIQGYSATYKEPFGFRIKSNSLFFNAIRNNEETFLKFYPLLIKHNPKFIFGYARGIALMCRFMIKNNLPAPKVKAMINYGEYVPESDIQLVKDTLGCNYFEVYSLTENSALINTYSEGKMYPVRDFFYPEIIDRHENVIVNGSGELVGTAFYNYAMPLIRYRTRDLVDVSDDTSNPYIKGILGRKNDKILLSDGTEILFIEDPLSMGGGKVRAGQYIQEKVGELNVNVIVDEDFDPATFAEMEASFRKRLGDKLNYNFNIVQELEKRGDGKVPFIINRLP